MFTIDSDGLSLMTLVASFWCIRWTRLGVCQIVDTSFCLMHTIPPVGAGRITETKGEGRLAQVYILLERERAATRSTGEVHCWRAENFWGSSPTQLSLHSCFYVYI